MPDEDHNPILDQLIEEMDIVPYTRRDKIWNWCIYFLVITNAISLVVIIAVWGSVW